MSTGLDARRNLALLARAGARLCALPLFIVIETMRPLPVERVSGTPSFVRGVSLIRGLPTPVVDLGRLLGDSETEARRFVTLRLGERQVALAVESVLEVVDLASTEVRQLPPLLSGASKNALETIATLDQEMLAVLQAGWQLPPESVRALGLEEKETPDKDVQEKGLREKSA